MNDPNQWFLCVLLAFFLVLVLLFYIILHLIQLAELQQLVVLLLSGFIQLYAGFFLFKANSWECFTHMKGVISLVPTLMDLKGNLEISMASRVSTLANTTDHMKTFQSTTKILKQNIILIQSQVTVVSLFAVIITILYIKLSGYDLTPNKVILLCAIGLTTGSITCSLLGSFVTIIISFISRSGYDPDDVATSIAASFGDLITVFLIVMLTYFFYNQQNKSGLSYLTWLITFVILFCFPFLFYCAMKNPETRPTMIYSWPAIIISTIISLCSGFIFESSNESFKQITLILPMFSGFVGNSVSIVASLISTTFHRLEMNEDKTDVKWFLTPKDIFVNYEYNEKISKTCRSHLIHAIVPCQFAYLLTLRILSGEDFLKMTLTYTMIYLSMSVILLIVMIFLTCNFIHIMYRLNWDPCESVIPLTTSVTDLFGSIMLSIFFNILKYLSDPNVYVKPL